MPSALAEASVLVRSLPASSGAAALPLGEATPPYRADRSDVGRGAIERAERRLRRLHALAVSLAAARARVVLPLARIAGAIIRTEAHHEAGYARLDDYARERHGRGGRWIRDLALLQRYFDRLPALAAAVAGDDGQAPLHVSAALAIGAVATAESAAEWIARGRQVSLAILKAELRERVTDSGGPGAAGGAEAADGSDGAGRADAADVVVFHSTEGARGPSPRHEALEPDRVRLRLMVPPAVRAAFDEGLDLHRAVTGSETSVASFIEALVAESLTEPQPSELACIEGRIESLMKGPDPEREEQALERAARGWPQLSRNGEAAWALREAGASLERLDELMRSAGAGNGAGHDGDDGAGGARQLDAQLAELLRLQNALELRLGSVLHEMGQMKGWWRLGLRDAGHYAERILGMSRTAAEDRVWVAASIRRFVTVREAYERGDLSWEATRSVLRLMRDAASRGEGPLDATAQHRWVEHARKCTVKRLRDEARCRSREEVADGGMPADGCASIGAATMPMSDAAWHASLRREPGTATSRMTRFGEILAFEAERQTATRRMDECVLTLRLPADRADDFLRAVRVRFDLLRRRVRDVPEDQPWPEPSAPASLRVTRTFSTRGWRPPLWVGLLGLIEDFVALHDPVEANVGSRSREEVFARSGYRCSAPGCTGRDLLQIHHIKFRSAGGGEELSNKESLCLFHHQYGIHRGLALAQGEAPMEVTWRLGRDELAEHFRNERRLGGSGGPDRDVAGSVVRNRPTAGGGGSQAGGGGSQKAGGGSQTGGGRSQTGVGR